ncbi:DAR GTPase 3, chloroplastic isoform X2 [Amborella trichopoda]|uniref:DAR GTPase 3, chloroplastic isoform X2 n=1 Tax=Amborella trichopoda TaxID=13333 RepID=UPI0009C0EEE6|nr:DAR GTPase 3, chloroplastic isoform X2 [Amborella trichopoda]|eukprot:XP_020532196.1 DAR GTPase 3, chloroplastic isoform X2 [Amborella trichopoda]
MAATATLLSPTSCFSNPHHTLGGCRNFKAKTFRLPALSPPTIQITQIAGEKSPRLQQRDNLEFPSDVDYQIERDWADLNADIYFWTKSLRPVQWYPGHIAKSERELKEQLKLMDVVIEVRDARIPLATSHPQMDSLIGNRRKIIVLNREDMISTADRNAWAMYFARQGTKVVFANGQLGMGTMKLGRLAKSLAIGVNAKRRSKGLLSCPVRAGIVGYPNVGKSSLINRLLKRRMCPAAPRPGVTRELKSSEAINFKWFRLQKMCYKIMILNVVSNSCKSELTHTSFSDSARCHVQIGTRQTSQLPTLDIIICVDLVESLTN